MSVRNPVVNCHWFWEGIIYSIPLDIPGVNFLNWSVGGKVVQYWDLFRRRGNYKLVICHYLESLALAKGFSPVLRPMP